MPYLEPNYLMSKQRYAIRTMFEKQRVLYDYPMRQFRFGVRSEAFNPDAFEFGHLRWGLCETPLGGTWYYRDRINPELSSTIRVGGVTVSDPFLGLSNQDTNAYPNAGKLFHQSFKEPLWRPGTPPTFKRVLSLADAYEDVNYSARWWIKAGQNIKEHRSVRETRVLREALNLYQSFDTFRQNNDEIPASVIERLMGNYFLSSWAPYVAVQYAVIELGLFSSTSFLAEGSKPVGKVDGWQLPFGNDSTARNSFRTFFDWFRAASSHVIDWEQRFTELLSGYDEVTLHGPGGNIVVDPGKEPEIIRDYITDVRVPFADLLQQKLHACSKVKAPYVSDRPSYEASRTTVLDELSSILTNELAPGWYDPTGSNQVSDDELLPYLFLGEDLESHSLSVRCATVVTKPFATERIQPLSERWPRRIYRDQRAGDIADRLSAIDWNMIMAIKDMPSIMQSICTIARFMTQVKRPHFYRNVIRVFSQQYLNYNFGIMPTVMDVTAAVNSLSQLLELEPVKAPIKTSLDFHGPRTCCTRPLPRQVEKVLDYNTENEIEVEAPQLCGYSIHLNTLYPSNNRARERVEVVGTMGLLPRQIQRYKGYYPQAEFKSTLGEEGRSGFLAAKAGISLAESLPAVAQTLWDLLPWSFIVDYFFDVSSYVVNYGAAERNKHIAIAELSDYRFTGYELCCTLSYHAYRYDFDERRDTFVESKEGPTFVLSRIGLREFRRFRGLADLPSAELKLSTPSVKQWFNIAAVLGAKSHLSSNKRSSK